MKRHSFADYESLSQAAAEQINNFVDKCPTASICLATGSTPTRTYELLARLNQSKNRFAATTIVKLDEWGGLTPTHPATCEHYLRKYFIEPMLISEDRFISFQANADEPALECKRIGAQLHQIGSIDLCILGLGINGHLGFNEPASTLTPGVHIAELTTQTQQHQMVEDTDSKPTFGYTLGMANLLQSKKIMLLVNGKHKEEQLERLFTGKIDTQFPASFLCLHPDVDLLTDI